jgi:hypothetical protein
MTTPAEITPAPEAAPTVTAPDADTSKAELAALSEQVAHMAGVMLAEVPDHLKPLIPADLSPAQQVAWFLKAKQTGVFGAVTVPATDTGKPTVTPKAPDVSTLPPVARMAAGYGAKH